MAASPSLQALLLGIIQGLTEFLPISSSAHLLLLPWLMDWKPMGVTFDVMLHGGTLLAVVVYFREDLKGLLYDLARRARGQGASGSPDLLWPLVAGTLPAVLVGGAFHRQLEETFRHPAVTVVTLAAFGILLWQADRRARQGREFADLAWLHGLAIGAAQTLAFIPGVSRSGVTITAALLLGFTRIDSARFSFLLAIPVIGLATAAKVYELIFEGGEASESALPLLIGVGVSFVSGFLCIKYFLKFLQTRSFAPFVVYRLLLAAVILAMLAG